MLHLHSGIESHRDRGAGVNNVLTFKPWIEKCCQDSCHIFVYQFLADPSDITEIILF